MCLTQPNHNQQKEGKTSIFTYKFFTDHVHRRAAQRPRHCSLLQRPGKAKVSELELDLVRCRVLLAGVREQDILRLHVTVNDALDL